MAGANWRKWKGYSTLAPAPIDAIRDSLIHSLDPRACSLYCSTRIMTITTPNQKVALKPVARSKPQKKFQSNLPRRRTEPAETRHDSAASIRTGTLSGRKDGIDCLKLTGSFTREMWSSTAGLTSRDIGLASSLSFTQCLRRAFGATGRVRMHADKTTTGAESPR
jgi:hypothetical protein